MRDSPILMTALFRRIIKGHRQIVFPASAAGGGGYLLPVELRPALQYTGESGRRGIFQDGGVERRARFPGPNGASFIITLHFP